MRAPVYPMGGDRSSDELRQLAARTACGHKAGRFHHPGGKARYRPSRDGTLIEVRQSRRCMATRRQSNARQRAANLAFAEVLSFAGMA